MKKKVLLFSLVFIFAFMLTGCGNKAGLEFKKEYESLNGTTNKSGKEHRTVTIDERNPYVKVTPEEIIKMLDKKETFYLYVGDSLCPWCRSAIEKSIEVAKKNKIKKIYYIEIWDDEGTEILRDKYEIVDRQLVKTVEGTESYKKLLTAFDELLSNYNVTDDKGNTVSTGEKRIYAPNYFYIKDGKAVKLINGYSSLQKYSREELTKEMLDDEEKQFNELFNN